MLNSSFRFVKFLAVLVLSDLILILPVHAGTGELLDAIRMRNLPRAVSILERFQPDARINTSNHFENRYDTFPSSLLDTILDRKTKKSSFKHLSFNFSSKFSRKNPSNNEMELQVINPVQPEDLEDTDSFGNTPLILAIENGMYSLVPVLLKKGANINHANLHENTPFLLALQKRDIQLVDILMSAKPDVNHHNEKGETALHWSVAWLSERVTRQILELGADPMRLHK
jgi:ankyrin repeat protein